MMHALTEWGFHSVDFLVPDRFRFGYGLTPGIVAEAARFTPSLIVTVDNGISSIEGVAAIARRASMCCHRSPPCPANRFRMRMSSSIRICLRIWQSRTGRSWRGVLCARRRSALAVRWPGNARSKALAGSGGAGNRGGSATCSHFEGLWSPLSSRWVPLYVSRLPMPRFRFAR